MSTDTHEHDMLTSEPASPSSESQAQTMPLLGGMVRPDDLPRSGVEGESDLPSVGGGNGRWSILVGLVFIVAAGSLYMMRKTQFELVGAEEATELETRIDEALAGDLVAAKDTGQATDEIVSMFSTDPARQQVPLQYVQRNPFILPQTEEPEKQAEPEQEAEPSAAAEARRQRELREQLRAEASRMKLQTVMQGRYPMAIINGEIVKVGQDFGSFHVDKITERTIEMSAGKYSFTLQME